MTKFQRPKSVIESAFIHGFSAMEMKNTSRRKALLPGRLGLVLFSMLCSFGIARASTEVQVPVDNDADICSQFRRALNSDHVVDMTRDQLCQYNFTQRHAGGRNAYFRALDWKTVPGDTVGLTMKIFDANHPRSSSPTGEAINRADVLDYAKDQNQHHALHVKWAPFTLIKIAPDGQILPIAGYVLKSVGAYCSKKDPLGLKKGRSLIAFYINKALTNSLPIISFLADQDRTEPLQIHGKDYLVTIMDRTMYGTVHYSDLTGTYAMRIDQIFLDNRGISASASAVCGFTFVRRPSRHGD